ncbi:MAG: hypothetical protein IJQ81_08080 [Oscillibacter sp.]|nr:hypothetical protein [Oscillibacter sp.]
MVERLHKCRKFIFYLLGWLELFVSALIVLGILLYLTSVPGLLSEIPQGGFNEYLSVLFDILIALELVKLLCRNDLYSMVEILLFAVTRHIIIERLSILETLIGVAAIAILFAIRKFLFLYQETHEEIRHRREHMD